MARKIFVAFFLGFVFLSMIGFHVTKVDARTKQMLQQRTQLRPVAWPEGKKLWFAPGSYWVDEFEGGVQSGTLDEENKELKIWNGNGRTVRFGRGFIRFEAAGGVKEGTLASGTAPTLPVVNTGGRNNQTISLAPGTVVAFGYDGGVMQGTLSRASSFFPEGMNTNRKNYPKGATLYFNGAGQVIRHVLPTDATVPPGESTNLDGTYTGTCNVNVLDKPETDGGQTIQVLMDIPFDFTARNGVFHGVTEVEKTCKLDYKGNYAKDGVISNGALLGWAEINHWTCERDFGVSCKMNHKWRNNKAQFGGTVSIQYIMYSPKNCEEVFGPGYPEDAVRGHGMRWTVHGPVTGTIARAGANLRMKATGDDGFTEANINCTATRGNANIATSVVLLLDLSDSMKGQKLSDAKAAAKKVIRTMPADFEIGIMTYAGACGQIFPFMSFTQDKQKLENAIDSLTTGGATPLSDALTQAAEAIRKVGNGKRGKIILLCDGQDSCNGNLIAEATLIGKSIGVKMPEKGGKTSSAQTRFWAYLSSEYWKGALGQSIAWAADPAGFTRTDFKKLQAAPGRQTIPIKIYTVGLQVSKSQQKVMDDVATAGGGTSASAENMEELTKAFNDAIIDKPAPTPTPEPANRDKWQSLRPKTSPPPITQNPQPTPQRPPSDDGWAPIGGTGSSTTRDKSGSTEGQRNIPKGHKTPYGF